MAELLQILFLVAIQFSGLQGVQPPVAALHHHEMMLQVYVLGQLVTFCARLEMLASQHAKARAFRLNKMWYRTQR